ncbi:nuclear transport factor 2 family protein [Trebonia kvetii]|uniref:Nuclear transport factor 2 family protein n=1 Tax=Trebonia kvetii TaxID=2480626 RepID=A0A6P2BT24_9ACTN|nr:nuclear transport factor 2 family protein [Trebonia kvetii]TVZ02184.1 nuclear transport factor 2 family protein [Trebonia kvetii]
MTTAELGDRAAIVDVVSRYTYSLDERDWTLLDQVFSADAVGRYGGPGGPPLEGRDAIVAFIRSFLDGCGPTQHLLGNHMVEVAGEEATARCKARVYHHGAGERAALTPYECFGVYRDRLRRTAEGWRITERVFDVQLAVGDIAILQPAPAATV